MINEILKEIQVDSERMKQSVIDSFIQNKEDRIVKASIKLVEETLRLNGELRKINRPDVITYEDPVTKSGEIKSYSAERVKKIQELNNKISQLETKVTKAYDTGDFSTILG